MGNLANIIFLLGLASAGGFMLVQSRIRTSKDVIYDLEDFNDEDGAAVYETSKRGKQGKRTRFALKDELSSIGLYKPEERIKFRLRQKLTPVITASLFLLYNLMFTSSGAVGAVVSTGLGLSVGYLYERYRFSGLKEQHKRNLEFFLPIVMERIVMAVQAGFDIIAAVRAVLDTEEMDSDSAKLMKRPKKDPVSELMDIAYQLTESGLTFERSLNDVAALVDSSPLRHAFIHLAMAHKEGGELVMPLRELSDSTQLYFQESVEEEIAKMPVKATLPLLFTFVGLILCFLTSPIIQVMELTASAMLP